MITRYDIQVGVDAPLNLRARLLVLSAAWSLRRDGLPTLRSVFRLLVFGQTARRA